METLASTGNPTNMDNAVLDIPLAFDPGVLRSRIKQRVSLGEFFGLALGLGLLLVFIWLNYQSPDRVSPHDFQNYMDAGRGNYHEYYYGFWLMPVLNLLAQLPFSASFLIWGVVNIFCVYFAARVFSGKAVYALLTYQFLSTIYIGQITGLIVGGLALFWWAAANKKWYLAGLGLLIAIAKYQTGLIFGGLLFLMMPVSFRDRIKILAVPLVGVILSFFLYPGWPATVLATMKSSPPNDWSSISLWQWIGPAALLLYGGAITLPGTIRARLFALIILTPLAFPYFQEYDLLILFCLPFGAWVLLGNLGFLYFWYSWDAFKVLMIVPVVFYITFALPSIKSGFAAFRKRFAVSRE